MFYADHLLISRDHDLNFELIQSTTQPIKFALRQSFLAQHGIGISPYHQMWLKCRYHLSNNVLFTIKSSIFSKLAHRIVVCLHRKRNPKGSCCYCACRSRRRHRLYYGGRRRRRHRQHSPPLRIIEPRQSKQPKKIAKKSILRCVHIGWL